MIRTCEKEYKEYENGGYYNKSTEIENGVVTYSLHIVKRDENGFSVHSYSEYKRKEGNKISHNVNYTDDQDATNNYTLSKETVDGVLTYYYCAVEKVTVMEGVKGRQNVTYNSDEGKYTLHVEYTDESGSFVGKDYDYPADEYTHGEWETFEYSFE